MTTKGGRGAFGNVRGGGVGCRRQLETVSRRDLAEPERRALLIALSCLDRRLARLEPEEQPPARRAAPSIFLRQLRFPSNQFWFDGRQHIITK